MSRGLVLFYLGLVTCLTSACITPKDFIYLQEAPIAKDMLTEFPNSHVQYRIQPDDVLSIRVKSLDPKNSEVFNLERESGFNQINPGFTYLNGYSVNDSGNIFLPILGSIYVGGLTVNETQEKIQIKLNEFLKESSVLVNLVSFKVSVLGEVRNPGQFYIYNNRFTLFGSYLKSGRFD